MGLLRMMFQGGRLLEFTMNVVKGPTCKVIVVRFEEMESSKAIESRCDLEGEEHSSNFLFSELFNFSSFMEMPIVFFFFFF